MIKFDGVEGLIAQMDSDEKISREYWQLNIFRR
jgi:FAD synthase